MKSKPELWNIWGLVNIPSKRCVEANVVSYASSLKEGIDSCEKLFVRWSYC